MLAQSEDRDPKVKIVDLEFSLHTTSAASELYPSYQLAHLDYRLHGRCYIYSSDMRGLRHQETEQLYACTVEFRVQPIGPGPRGCPVRCYMHWASPPYQLNRGLNHSSVTCSQRMAGGLRIDNMGVLCPSIIGGLRPVGEGPPSHSPGC